MVRLALIAALLAGCGEKKQEPPPAPAPKTRPAPTRRPPPAPEFPGAPDCGPVLAGLDMIGLCGAPFELVAEVGPDRCSLVPSPDSPRDVLVRIDVERATTRRLPPSHPKGGRTEDRGRTSTARRGAFPWLIDARSRGPEEPLCTAKELSALTARVAELLPPDPDAAELEPNPRCEAILSLAQVKRACKTELDALIADDREDGADTFCSRYTERMGLQFRVSRKASRSTGGAPVIDHRGNIAIADKVGDYTVELRSNREAGSGEAPCDKKELARLFSRVKARAARALR